MEGKITGIDFENEEVSKTTGEEDWIWHYDFETVCKEGLHEWKGLFRDKCRSSYKIKKRKNQK